MGANIGTTVTNTLASLGHVRQNAYFQRAFAAATVHDYFNLLAVAILLPLEVAFGLITKIANGLANLVEKLKDAFRIFKQVVNRFLILIRNFR